MNQSPKRLTIWPYQDRRDGTHDRSHVLGELFGRELQPLLHELARAIDVHAPVELDEQDREPDPRVGADAHDAGRSVHGCLERPGDQRLDLFRSQARRLGQHGHERAVQIRKDIDWKIADHDDPVDEDQQ